MIPGSWETIDEAMLALVKTAQNREGMLAQREAMAQVRRAVMALPDRRERIAIAALQGLLASSEPDAGLALAYEEAAVAATRYADALITALDAPKELP